MSVQLESMVEENVAIATHEAELKEERGRELSAKLIETNMDIFQSRGVDTWLKHYSLEDERERPLIENSYPKAQLSELLELGRITVNRQLGAVDVFGVAMTLEEINSKYEKQENLTLEEVVERLEDTIKFIEEKKQSAADRKIPMLKTLIEAIHLAKKFEESEVKG